MALDCERISSSQLYFMMLGFLIGSTALLVPGRIAEHDQWIASLLSLVEGLPVALLYTGLAVRLGNKTVIATAPEILGRWPGKAAAALFIVYMAHLGSLVLTNYNGFIASVILPRTPPAVIAVLLVMVCAFAVRGGLEVIARCSVVLVPVILAIFTLDTFFLINDINLSLLLPVLEVPAPRLLESAHTIASFPLNETVVFAAIIPFVSGGPRAKYRTVMLAIASGAVLVSAALVRIYAVLGPTGATLTYPLYSAVRMISLGNIFTRLEVLVFVNVLTMGFIKIAVLLYGASGGIAQLLGLRDYRPLVFPLAILTVIVSLINFPGSLENAVFAEKIYPVYAPFFQIGFPLLVFFLARIRGIPRPGPGRGQPSEKKD